MESIVKKNGNINITIDYRTELLGILMWISDYNKVYPIRYEILENEFYIQNIIDKFSSFKEETIVKNFENLYKNHPWFGYDSPMNLFLQLDDHFKCEKINDYVYREILSCDNRVYDFIDQLENFSEKVDFPSYYENNKDSYIKWIDNISKVFDSIDLKQYINNYYGYDNYKELYINLLPYATGGGYNVTLEDRIYSNLSVDKGATKDNLFSVSHPNNFILFCLHEISHGYVDSITDNLNLVNESTDLFDDIREKMSGYAYPTDKEILNEHIIRAIEIRTIDAMFHDVNWYDYRIKQEKEMGFIYIEPIVDSLKEYENNRDMYSRFDMFYPIIVDNIKNYKEENKKV